MLNGIDPILLFHFFKLTDEKQKILDNKLPTLVAKTVKLLGLPPIPIYLSEALVVSENRNIDIETNVEATKDGKEISTSQRPVNSVVTIEMIASKNSVGLTVLTAMMDVILPLVSSLEYSISYLHGSVTIFNGLLHSFNVSQSSDDDIQRISLALQKTNQKTETQKQLEEGPKTPRSTGTLPIS